MKRVDYICNRCGKVIDRNAVYSISPERIDPENEELTLDIPRVLEEEFHELLADKHLCLTCIRKTLKFFNAPAVINPKFEVVVMGMEYPMLTIRAEELVPEPVKISSDPFTPEDVRQWVSQKKKLRELKELMGLNSDISVYNYFDKHGIDTPTRPAKVKPVKEKFLPKSVLQESPEVKPAIVKVPEPEPVQDEIKMYPEMTVEAVRILYTDTRAHMSEVAKVFGKRSDEVYAFVNANGLRRTDKRDEGFTDAGRLAVAGVQA